MKLHLVFGIIALFLISSSCKKKGQAIVKGTVREMGSGLPIANAKVKLGKSTGNKDEAGYVVETTTTDNNGEFTINYYKDWDRKYGLSAECTNYFSSISGGMIPEDNKNYTASLELSPYAYIKFRFKKNTTSLNYASMFCPATSYANNNINSSKFELITPYQNYPYIYDTILPTVYSTYGNMNVNIWKNIYTYPFPTPNNPTVFKDIININKGETLTYLVEFN